MTCLLIHLLFLLLAFINNVNADNEVEAGEDSGGDEDSSNIEEDNSGIEGGSSGIDEDSSGIDEDSSGIDEDSSGIEEDNSGIDEDSSGIGEDSSGIDEDSSGIDEDRSGIGEDSSGIDEDSSGTDEDNGEDFLQECVSGEMMVNEQSRGVVRVLELSEGDFIYGIVGEEWKHVWCKVEAVFPSAGGKNKITYDGFTADHMVVDYTVHPYGKKGEARVGPVYTLTTDCDASVNSVGQIFTPISTAFCAHELSWSEYITLMSAVRRVTKRTGYFWFDTSAYHDNETAMVPHWLDQLHQICHQLLLCSRESRCQRFENAMAEFVHDHLNKKYADVVERIFPNMGSDVNKQKAGTITEVVHPQGSCHPVLFSSLGIAIVVLLDLIMVIALLAAYRMLKEKETKKELPVKS